MYHGPARAIASDKLTSRWRVTGRWSPGARCPDDKTIQINPEVAMRIHLGAAKRIHPEAATRIQCHG